VGIENGSNVKSKTNRQSCEEEN